jgi:hemerythrin-like metal-binding protein
MTQAISIERLLLLVPQMDDEHRKLISQANEYASAVEAGASRAELELRLTQLVEAFQVHFASEERLMQSNNFPGFEPHAAEHRKLIGQMTSLRDCVGAGDVQICNALVLFVRVWTEQHIDGLDRSFAQFLREGKAPCGTGLFSIGQ